MYLIVETVRQEAEGDKPEWKSMRQTFRAELGEGAWRLTGWRFPERECEMGFGSRPQLIGTGSTGLASARLNLAGGAKGDEQRKPASLLCCLGALSLGNKIRILGLSFPLNTEVRNYGGYKALERKRGAVWGEMRISEMGGTRLQGPCEGAGAGGAGG